MARVSEMDLLMRMIGMMPASTIINAGRALWASFVRGKLVHVGGQGFKIKGPQD